ncbi:hypothetical protein J7I98_23680 [Streptomyces sp. ISL-98]|uniref:hypothetical protein n=1 Tax=Streptomyces sp. ISL-98 TaxID=2819192 RepID=UPI001BE62703|nr:hypothetical protein [Streptomyces sp. ISL-98]MBT2508832.1 hypothetical protein [Streptomyces sp. ISL-98]
MSDTDTDEQPDTDEPQGMSERTARVLLTGVLLLAMWGVVAALPEMAYVVVGIASTLGWQRCRTWREARGKGAKEQDKEQLVDVVAHLRALGVGGGHVLLTHLQAAAGLPDTKTVRALLDKAGVQVRAGVRTAQGNGPGVHQDDIPPLTSSPVGGACGGGCLCSSGANANANNADESGPEKGFRVEAIGQAGTVVHDPSEAHRRHTLRTR